MLHQPARVRETVVDTVADVLGTQRETVADVLGTQRETVAAADDLSRLDGFASFQMVETVERLEDAYNVQFAPGDLEPAALRHVDGLVNLVLRTAQAEVSHQ
ncbi:phosphopantetheine-binding protein [Streptomyces sp. NPDC054844]